MKWTKQFVKWFSEGDEEADLFLDIPWDTQVDKGKDRDIIVVSHPRIPFEIVVHVDKYFASLYMDMNVPTDAMSLEDRMRIYKKLLILNMRFKMMKTGLAEEVHKITLSADLDLGCLNRTEFSNALENLILASQHLVEKLDLEEEVGMVILERAAAVAYKKLEAGESEKEILDFLTYRVGIEAADNFLEKLIKIISDDEEDNMPKIKEAPSELYR